VKARAFPTWARPPDLLKAEPGRTGPNRAAGRLGQAAEAGGRLAKPGKAHAATEDPPQPQALPLLQGSRIPRPEPDGSNPAESGLWWPGGRIVGNCPIQTARLRGVILPWRYRDPHAWNRHTWTIVLLEACPRHLPGPGQAVPSDRNSTEPIRKTAENGPRTGVFSAPRRAGVSRIWVGQIGGHLLILGSPGPACTEAMSEAEEDVTRERAKDNVGGVRVELGVWQLNRIRW